MHFLDIAAQTTHMMADLAAVSTVAYALWGSSKKPPAISFA
jgi:hypothetical protein